jgi:hypothetical protein
LRMTALMQSFHLLFYLFLHFSIFFDMISQF